MKLGVWVYVWCVYVRVCASHSDQLHYEVHYANGNHVDSSTHVWCVCATCALLPFSLTCNVSLYMLVLHYTGLQVCTHIVVRARIATFGHMHAHKDVS